MYHDGICAIRRVPPFREIRWKRGMAADKLRRVGLRAVAVSAVLLTLFGLGGERLVTGIGISSAAFRIAGGVLLLLTALAVQFIIDGLAGTVLFQ